MNALDLVFSIAVISVGILLLVFRHKVVSRFTATVTTRVDLQKRLFYIATLFTGFAGIIFGLFALYVSF